MTYEVGTKCWYKRMDLPAKVTAYFGDQHRVNLRLLDGREVQGVPLHDLGEIPAPPIHDSLGPQGIGAPDPGESRPTVVSDPDPSPEPFFYGNTALDPPHEQPGGVNLGGLLPPGIPPEGDADEDEGMPDLDDLGETPDCPDREDKD